MDGGRIVDGLEQDGLVSQGNPQLGTKSTDSSGLMGYFLGMVKMGDEGAGQFGRKALQKLSVQALRKSRRSPRVEPPFFDMGNSRQPCTDSEKCLMEQGELEKALEQAKKLLDLNRKNQAYNKLIEQIEKQIQARKN